MEKEAQHLAGGVRALRVGIGCRCVTARPRVAGAVDQPVLHRGLGAAIDGARVGAAAGFATLGVLPYAGDGVVAFAVLMVGTDGRSEAASLRCPLIAAIADTASRAEAYGKPEWMPAAA